MQRICCTVKSTGYVFLPSNVETCANVTIASSEIRGIILRVVGIKYGREFILPVLQYLGN